MAKTKEVLTLEEQFDRTVVKDEQQPYRVPDNWVWTRLESVVYRPREKTEDFSSNQKYIGLENMNRGAGIISIGTAENLKSLKNTFHAGQILYGKLRPYLNKHDIAPFDGVCSTDILVFTANGSEAKFINYFLDTVEFMEYVVQNSKGIHLPRVSEKAILNCEFPLPPLAEQQRIITRIESLFSKLDRAKELAQNALDTFENRRAILLHKAFTGELTEKWRDEKGVGLDSWAEKKLKEIAKISSGGTPSRKNPEYFMGDIPWLKTGEISWNEIFNSEEKITIEAIENSSAKIFPKGTVVVAMYGQGLTRGRAGILQIEATTNQAFCALIAFDTVNNKFLFYYFMHNYWYFREKAMGTNQLNFSGTMISNFEINLPTLPEQTEIVRILDSVFEKETQAKELASVIEKISLMKKVILGRAFRGELGTNNPNEEGAMELLREILKGDL